MARFDRYNVTIQSMQVTDVDDGWGGGDLEATFTFTVNGQAQDYKNGDLDVGFHTIGLTFTVEVPTDANEIVVAARGTDEDGVFDDNLVGFTRVFGQAQDWGVGSNQENKSDSNITYALNYQIDGIAPVFEVLPRDVLLAFSRLRAEAKKIDRSLSEETLLSASLNWLNRHGWQIVSITDKEYVLKGVGDLPKQMLKRVTA